MWHRAVQSRAVARKAFDPFPTTMDLELLDRTLTAGQPAFRARQVWEWAAKGAQGV